MQKVKTTVKLGTFRTNYIFFKTAHIPASIAQTISQKNSASLHSKWPQEKALTALTFLLVVMTTRKQ